MLSARADDTVNVLVNVTPGSFTEEVRSMSGSAGGAGCCCDFRLGSVNMISFVLEWFSIRLFSLDHISMFSI